MVYTSYFAKLKVLPPNIIPITICGKVPDWYNGLQYKKLAPKYDFFMEWKKTHNNDFYIQQYKTQVLNRIDAATVVKELFELIENDVSKSICLICYEKANDFCHRHLVAEWLNDNGFQCKEWI